MTLTSNIQKGGALLGDTLRMVDVWDPTLSPEANLRRISELNLLGKATRSRADDVMRRILRPRFVDPGPQVIAALKVLAPSPRAFAEACYYEASREDSLLAAFAEGPLATWHDSGRLGVDVSDVVRWLGQLESSGAVQTWTDSIRTKVARGLLAALREFGVLGGRVKKDILQPSLTPRGFAYVAFRLYEQGASSRGLVGSAVWRRWLLHEGRVVELFQRAEHLGLLRYSEAGSIVRIDWLVPSLREVVSVAA